MTEAEAYKLLTSMPWANDKNGVFTAVEIAIKALEKQVVKKPETEIGYSWTWFCPNCAMPYGADDKNDYCSECGQKILWEDEE